MLDFFYDVEENGEVAIDVLAVIVALLCVFIARFFATPGVYAKKSQYFQLPGLTLKFVDDAAKVARGPTLSEIPDVCEDMRACFAAGLSLPLQKRRQQLMALLKMIREHEAEMLAALRDDENVGVLAHRPALGNNPPVGWDQRVARTLMRVAPEGLTRATTMACGACANEHAMKAVFIAAANERRGGRAISDAEKESCLTNAKPGSPGFKILSFDGAFHGRTAACLSLTHTKWIHKLDFPTFDWPSCPFPKLKYPLDRYERENAAEEARCLAEVEAALDRDADVVGVIVEPMQAEGGDNHASADFFQKLRALTKSRGVRMIVDEVQTGCGSSGTFWAHEAWNLEHPPDVVTFSKKMQIAGFYAVADLAPELPYRIFNTWMGDPAKLVQLEVVLDCIEENNLLDLVKSSGATLLEGLEKLQAKFPQQYLSY